MTLAFTHETLRQRILFGTGKATVNVATEMDRLGTTRPMVIAAPSKRSLAETVADGVNTVLWWDDVNQHVPLAVAERARSAAVEYGFDVLLSIGGGGPRPDWPKPLP